MDTTINTTNNSEDRMVDLRFRRFYVAYKKTGVPECRSCTHRYTINLIAVVVDE